MTLVVGMANAEIAFLVGDTLLTPLLDIKGNPAGAVNGEFHGLKIQILNDRVAIAFSSSNAAVVALGIIADVWRTLQSNSQADVCGQVLEHYQQALRSCGKEKPDCEFLVLQLAANGNRLAHITANEIRPCERSYIGDQAQYKRMNDLRRPYQSPTEMHVQQTDGTFKVEKMTDSKGQLEFMEVSLALETLVQRRNKAVGGIGGNIIRSAMRGLPETWSICKSAWLRSTPRKGNPASLFFPPAQEEGALEFTINLETGLLDDGWRSRNVHQGSLGKHSDVYRTRAQKV